MKIKDFENAIDALGMVVSIDEVKLSNGMVRLVLGHTQHNLLIWDSAGRAFSIHYEEPYFCTEENHEYHRISEYERDPVFDLKFE